MNFTLREVDKKFMSERAYRTPLHAHILCGGLVTALALLEALFFFQFLVSPCPFHVERSTLHMKGHSSPSVVLQRMFPCLL